MCGDKTGSWKSLIVEIAMLHKHGVKATAALLLLFTSPLLAAAQQENNAALSTPDTTQYVGTDTCKTCHEDLVKQFEQTAHFASVLNKKADAAHQGCESCHGPGKAHVDGGGDVSKIISFKNLSGEEASKRCLACHSAEHEQGNFLRSEHAAADIGCVRCHSPHKAWKEKALLIEKTPRLCYECHTETRAEFDRPFRHRVNQNLIECNDCHNPHGTTRHTQLRASAEEDQVCYKCHREKKGPFVFEHLPVKTEGCNSCHTPHGSPNPHLLKVSQVNQLCLECHTQAMSNVPSQPPIGPAHNQATKYQACTMCHAFIHGSNFSEVFFKP